MISHAANGKSKPTYTLDTSHDAYICRSHFQDWALFDVQLNESMHRISELTGWNPYFFQSLYAGVNRFAERDTICANNCACLLERGFSNEGTRSSSSRRETYPLF